MRFQKTPIVISLVIFSVTLLLYFSYNTFFMKADNKFQKQFFIEGYNFRKFQSEEINFSEYKVGENIDLSKLQTTGGESFLSTTDKNLILLAVIDKDCHFCRVSKDIMDDIRKTTKEIEIEYIPVSFDPTSSHKEIRIFTQSIGFNDSLSWESQTKPPNKLISMPTPAHILVNRTGRVLQVWFSSNNDKKIRTRMSNQVTSDLLLINDVYQISLHPKSKEISN